MKHITIALDDKLVEDIERVAAERGTTVDAIMRHYLTGFALENNMHDPAARAKVRNELAKLGKRTPGRLGEWKWNRDDLYAERFSRYEYPGLRGHGDGRGPGEGGKGK